jgi:2-methylcitrate dehydratase PrpD
MAIQPPKGFPSEAGWGLTSWQIFASMVPAAKLFKLDKEKFEQALGIAAVLMALPNNLVHKTLSNVYHYQHGFCAQDGVLGVMLADHGVDGMYGAFDGPDGFGKHHLLTAGDDFWYLEGLGERYLIMETLLKNWPTNMWVQSSLDLINDFIKEDGLTAENFEKIIVDPPTQRRMMYDPDGYDKIIAAQYSIPYCIAALILDPVPGPQWFTNERMRDPELLKIAAKVEGSGKEPELLLASFDKFQEGSFPHKSITVKFKDGRIKTREITYPKGHPRNMFTMDEVAKRFYMQTSSVLSHEKAERALQMLLNIEQYDSLENIGEILSV